MRNAVREVVLFGSMCVLAGICFADGVSIISETSGTAQYIGVARTDRDVTPSTNDPVWRISKKVETSDGNFTYKTGYTTNSSGTVVETIAWTNRVNAIYK